MTCIVNWAGFIGSPPEWVERCCDVRVAASCGGSPGSRLLDTGLGPEASLQCKTSGSVFQALRVWKRGSKVGLFNFDNMVPIRTGILCAVVPTGILHLGTGYIFFQYAYVFLCTCKCTQKICLQAAYKQK